MPRGYATIIYKGGPNDGQIDEVHCYCLKDEFNTDPVVYFIEDEQGNLVLRSGKRTKSKMWVMYPMVIYKKASHKIDGMIVYEFSHIEENHRCKSITKIGERCRSVARHGFELCGRHYNQQQKT